MKLTDGLFHKVFRRVTKDYPDLVNRTLGIVDIGTASGRHSPRRLDVVVMPNLYGDILSDVAAQLAAASDSPACQHRRAQHVRGNPRERT